jgi:hypothetical protein
MIKSVSPTMIIAELMGSFGERTHTLGKLACPND